MSTVGEIYYDEMVNLVHLIDRESKTRWFRLYFLGSWFIIIKNIPTINRKRELYVDSK
jgi:hypothetical protein